MIDAVSERTSNHRMLSFRIMLKPRVDFFLIGAARCGTTSLYKILGKHPRIFAPAIKEPRFFKGNWEKGWDWYTQIFEGASDGQIVGDFSPSYSTASNNVIARRIHHAYPSAKILYIVRNPIDCAISNWRMIAEVYARTPGFAEALEEWSGPLLDRALFWRQLSYFREFYPDEQIKVVSLEQLRSDETVLQDTFDFLGIDRMQATFPKANTSNRKPDRPGKPHVPNDVREKFVNLVREDADQILQYAGFPPDLWDITPGYKGWLHENGNGMIRKMISYITKRLPMRFG